MRPGLLRYKLVVSKKPAGVSGVEYSVEEICTYDMAVKQCWGFLWLQRSMYAGSAGIVKILRNRLQARDLARGVSTT